MPITEESILMASNMSVAVKDGEAPGLSTLGDLPNSAFETEAVEKHASTAQNQKTFDSGIQRETGDQVNRFLLCALISESSKSIKASAEKAGESLPMSMIVRGVLRLYRAAAKDKYGPLAEGVLDIAGLRVLNEQVLRGEIARHSRDRVSNSQRQLALAQRHGDDTQIKAGKDALDRAIAWRDRSA
jgi:hypothetical protein